MRPLWFVRAGGVIARHEWLGRSALPHRASGTVSPVRFHAVMVLSRSHPGICCECGCAVADRHLCRPADPFARTALAEAGPSPRGPVGACEVTVHVDACCRCGEQDTRRRVSACVTDHNGVVVVGPLRHALCVAAGALLQRVVERNRRTTGDAFACGEPLRRRG